MRFFLCLFLFVAALLAPGGADVTSCKASCADGANRLVGPTRPPNSRGHPYFPAPDPNVNMQFCRTGCALFFEHFPVLSECDAECDFIYRYDVSVGYSDHAEVARLECRDGCNIALLKCQAGFYCTDGQMRECAPGRYRGEIDPSEACIDCPRGRYRSEQRGRSLDSCDKCPAGKYVNVTGSTETEACLRCPAGKFADEPGIALCKCITTRSHVGVSDDIAPGDYEFGSCEPGDVNDPTRETLFFKDPYRNTVPFVGNF